MADSANTTAANTNNSETTAKTASTAADKTTSQNNSTSGLSNVEAMKNARERIINLSYKFDATSDGGLVDIVRDYPWILDTVNSNSLYMEGDYKGNTAGSETTGAREGITGQHYTNVPVCYMVERKSIVNAAVANILNILSTINDIGETMKGGANATSGIVSDVLKAGSEGIASFKKMVNGLLPAKTLTLLGNNNLNEEVLNPYRYLYITAATGKKYVFPITSKEASSFMPGKLSWGDFKGGMPKMLKTVFDIAQNVLTTVAGGANIIRNFASLGLENGDDNNTVSEMPKAFTYPKTGDAMQVQFTLYNTTRKNAWKNNFRFLYLFAVRNLPFRTETLSFVPPLLYDIIIPGVKRMPVSALSGMSVVPKGMIRVLQCDNFLDGNGSRKIQVNVPEAWEVTLNFQSLIAPSANLLLSTLIGTIGIKALTDPSSLLKLTDEEYAIEKEKLSETEKEIKGLCTNIKKSEQFDKAVVQMQQAKAAGYANRLREHIGTVLAANDDAKDTDSWSTALKDDPLIKTIKSEMKMDDSQFNTFLEDNLGLATPKDYYSIGIYDADKFSSPGANRIGNSKGGKWPAVNSNTYKNFDEMVAACDKALSSGDYSSDTKTLWNNDVQSVIQNNYYSGGTGNYSELKGSNGTPYNSDYVSGKETPASYIAKADREKTLKKIQEMENERKEVENARGTESQYTPLCDNLSSNAN